MSYVYIGDRELGPDRRGLLIRCKCQRLNTLEDYRRNDGKCPLCGEPLREDD